MGNREVYDISSRVSQPAKSDQLRKKAQGGEMLKKYLRLIWSWLGRKRQDKLPPPYKPVKSLGSLQG